MSIAEPLWRTESLKSVAGYHCLSTENILEIQFSKMILVIVSYSLLFRFCFDYFFLLHKNLWRGTRE